MSDSYFLFADLVGFYTHWTYMHIFRHIFLSNYWWQKSDIWSQASSIGTPYRGKRLCSYSLMLHALWRSSRRQFYNLISLVLMLKLQTNKMNCELMLTYGTLALRQTGSRNVTGKKTLPTTTQSTCTISLFCLW
jgi:hypothetical protein